MNWWEAALATLGVIFFWPILITVGDLVDRWFQAWQTVRLQKGVEQRRTERLAAEKAEASNGASDGAQ